MFLLSWDSYKCPSALSMASICLREGAFYHLLRLISWRQLLFLPKELDHLLPDGRSITRTKFTTALLLCLPPFSLAVVLSSLAVLHQAMKSVPGFLGAGGFWGRALDLCVGAIQGLLGAVVLPVVGMKLLDNRLSFFVITGLFTSCILPAAVILFLDTHCLGGWSAFWHPCRTNPKQFNRLVVLYEVTEYPFELLRSTDVCDSHQARAQTSLSKCMQVALLRLQDLWLPKIITSGVVIPAVRLMFDAYYTDSDRHCSCSSCVHCLFDDHRWSLAISDAFLVVEHAEH